MFGATAEATRAYSSNSIRKKKSGLKADKDRSKTDATLALFRGRSRCGAGALLVLLAAALGLLGFGGLLAAWGHLRLRALLGFGCVAGAAASLGERQAACQQHCEYNCK